MDNVENGKLDMEYVINKAVQRPSLKGQWEEPAWRGVPAIELGHFLPQSRSRHPRVEVKMVYRDDGLFLFFRVFDKFIRCVQTAYQSGVCGDSCVEFFVEPKAGRGYVNIEINAGGTLLLHYNEIQPDQSGKPSIKRSPAPWELGCQIVIYHSLPQTVEPEIEVNTEWHIEYFIPFKVFEHYLGPLGPIPGQIWRANFYKCADRTSHPHWLSWAPLGKEFSFHVPQYFAPIRFSV